MTYFLYTLPNTLKGSRDPHVAGASNRPAWRGHRERPTLTPAAATAQRLAVPAAQLRRVAEGSLDVHNRAITQEWQQGASVNPGVL